MKRRTRGLRAGFSVIEALAAVALLAVALAPLYAMLQQIAQATARIENFVEARDVTATVTSLLEAGMEVPERLQDWTVRVSDAHSTPPEAVDGYMGGNYFMLSVYTYVITLEKDGFSVQREYSRLVLDPIYETEEDAIFSNM